MSPEQQSACQADVDAVISAFGHAGIVGKVREEPAWTDAETDEVYPPTWVVEVRVGRGSRMRVVTIDVEGWDRARDAWRELMRLKVAKAIRRSGEV